jgi:hypothetical protein
MEYIKISTSNNFLKRLACLACLLIVSTTLQAADYLTPISNDRLLIDGSLSEWGHIRRHSAEHLVKGVIAEMDDFQAGIRIAYNSEWLFIGLDCSDSDLKFGRNGDRALVSLLSKNKKRVDLAFTFIARKNSSAKVLLTVNRSRTKLGKIASKFIAGKGYTLEAKLPMSLFSWIYGSEVKLAAIFTDKDRDGANSTFTTHLVNQKGFADDVSYVFGGPQLYKSIYKQQAPKFKTILEFSHDWVDDNRRELLLITDSEIVIFGEKIKKGYGYIRYVHGWREPKRIKARIKGKKRQSVLIIDHLNSDATVLKTEKYILKAGKFSQL